MQRTVTKLGPGTGSTSKGSSWKARQARRSAAPVTETASASASSCRAWVPCLVTSRRSLTAPRSSPNRSTSASGLFTACGDGCGEHLDLETYIKFAGWRDVDQQIGYIPSGIIKILWNRCKFVPCAINVHVLAADKPLSLRPPHSGS